MKPRTRGETAQRMKFFHDHLAIEFQIVMEELLKAVTGKSPEQIGKYIISLTKTRLSRENIRAKLSFLDQIAGILEYPDVDEQIHNAIQYSLFSFARDINPEVRLKALTTLATKEVIDPALIDLTLSKESSKSRLDQPHIGAFGACLEDAYPEIRAMTIQAMGATITKQDDPCAVQVMTAITQMINDSEVKVRSAAIKALCKVCRIINHLVTLEDPQLRLVLPVLTATDSDENDRSQVISFLSQVLCATYGQAYRIFEDLGLCTACTDSGITRCTRDQVMPTAYAFGQNNAQFLRLIAADFAHTLASAKLGAPDLNNNSVFIRMIAILAAYRKTPFMLPESIREIGEALTPILDDLSRKATKGQDSSNYTHLSELHAEITKSPAHLNHVLIKNKGLQDACDYVLGKYPPEVFRIESSPDDDNLVAVRRYRAEITVPATNSKYNPVIPSSHNFFLNIRGTVSPVPPEEIKVVVVIRMPLQNLMNMEANVNEDGTFKLNPVLQMPGIASVFPVKLEVVLLVPASSEEGVDMHFVISDQLNVWFQDATAKRM